MKCTCVVFFCSLESQSIKDDPVFLFCLFWPFFFILFASTIAISLNIANASFSPLGFLFFSKYLFSGLVILDDRVPPTGQPLSHFHGLGVLLAWSLNSCSRPFSPILIHPTYIMDVPLLFLFFFFLGRGGGGFIRQFKGDSLVLCTSFHIRTCWLYDQNKTNKTCPIRKCNEMVLFFFLCARVMHQPGFSCLFIYFFGGGGEFRHGLVVDIRAIFKSKEKKTFGICSWNRTGKQM